MTFKKAIKSIVSPFNRSASRVRNAFNNAAHNINKTRKNYGQKIKIFRREVPKLNHKDAIEITKDVFRDMSFKKAGILFVAWVVPGGIPIYLSDTVVKYTEKKAARAEQLKKNPKRRSIFKR